MSPILIAAIVPAIFALRMFWRNVSCSPAARLSKLMAQRADYRIFVGVPFAAPQRWAIASRLEGDSLAVEGHGTVRVSDVRAFAVAYPNGQLLDAEPGGLPMPSGLDGLYPTPQTESDTLRLSDLEHGKTYLQIEYAPSPARPRDRNHYATTLKNISTARIRVQRFAGYARSGEGWRLSTVTRKFYSGEEFREWYGLGSSEWIEPGQAVTDPNNYGSPPVLWAYYCESASGEHFISGGVLK